VWFEQNLESVDEHGMSSPYAPSTSFEVSTACAELERLSRLHRDKVIIEPVDAGSTFAQGARVIESVSQQRRSKLTFLQRLDACGHPPVHSEPLGAHSRIWMIRNCYSSLESEALWNRCQGTAMMGAAQRTD
jgi:hypothetical protein